MDQKSILRTKQKAVASIVGCGAIRDRDKEVDRAVKPDGLLSAVHSNTPVKFDQRALQSEPDKAILCLARALARQAAREDHARERADKARDNETSCNIRPLLD